MMRTCAHPSLFQNEKPKIERHSRLTNFIQLFHCPKMPSRIHKTVLLRERKRHTAYQVLSLVFSLRKGVYPSPGWGVPQSCPAGGVPQSCPGREGGGVRVVIKQDSVISKIYHCFKTRVRARSGKKAFILILFMSLKCSYFRKTISPIQLHFASLCFSN